MGAPYLFRREDTGEVVELEFCDVLRQDAAGYVDLPDGVTAKRCIHLELERDNEARRSVVKEARALSRPIVSDALGVSVCRIEEYEKDRADNGHTGIRFVPDPSEPTFYQVHADSRKSFNAYMKHRGMTNKGSCGGMRLSQADLDGAKTMVERVYGCATA